MIAVRSGTLVDVCICRYLDLGSLSALDGSVLVVSSLIIRLLRCHRYSSLSRRCRCSWTSERDSGLRIYSSLQGACLASNPFLHASLARTRTLDFWRHWLLASIPALCSLTLRVCICRPHALLPRLFPACLERRRLAMVASRPPCLLWHMRCCAAHALLHCSCLCTFRRIA